MEDIETELEVGEFDTMVVSEDRRHNPWVVLTSTGLAVFAVFLDTTIGFVSFPAISQTFSAAGPSTLSWVLNAYTLVFAALLIPCGRLADRLGRRRMFLTGVIVFTVGSMLCGLSPSVGVLIGAEMLEAVGAVAGAFGPTLGALVVSNLNWRWAFFINLPVGIVSFLLGRRVLPEGREAHPGRLPDPVGVVLLVASLALLAFAIVKTDAWGWLSASFV